MAVGEPAGQWSGAGADVLGLSGEVDADILEAIYHRLCDPRDPNINDRATWDETWTLGQPYKSYRSPEQIYAVLLAEEPGAGPERRAELHAQAERSARQPLAFLDATWSAQKSISVLGVAYERAAQQYRAPGDFGRAEVYDARARAVEDAVRAGAAASVAHLQEVAGLARTGHHGGGAGRWTDSHQWVVAAFLQHDSRDHDPQLHVHQAILNRQLCADGQWRALDSKAIHRERAAAGAIGERVAEAELTRTLGVRFEWTADGKSREIVGVSKALRDQFSTRTHAITLKTSELLGQFRENYGREPSGAELYSMTRQAWRETRQAKSHTGETQGERLDRWSREAAAETANGLAAVLLGVRNAAARAGEVPTWSPRDVLLRAVATAAERKASFTRSDLLRAVSDSLPANLGIPAADIPDLLNGLTDHALLEVVRLSHTETTQLPAHLLRVDGSSVYDSGQVFYAAPWQLAAEKALAERATQRGGEAFTEQEVAQVLAQAERDGYTLGHDQEHALREILAGGACVDVVRAAAGTGKSRVVGVLATAWSSQQIAPKVPGRSVFGLTTSQIAANVLANEGLQSTANIAAWLLTQQNLDNGSTQDEHEAWRLRRDDLVVVDEAGMVGTAELLRIAQRCELMGAKLVLVGDPRQLGAIGAGGALEDLLGGAPTHELVEVRRFNAAWEGPASLRLRDGDTTVIPEYATRGRLLDGGTTEQAQDAAMRGWLADYLRGMDTALLVPTNDAASRLNEAVRGKLVELGLVAEQGVLLGMRDETAGVGDLISARLNGRSLNMFAGTTVAPVNRDQYRVLETLPDGGLRVARVTGRDAAGEHHDTELVLPAAYVAAHVTLGYASTVHSVQGRTVDTCHTVLSALAASAAYVGLTRGRDRNTAYAITKEVGSEAPIAAAQEIEARTPEAVMADAMTRREPSESPDRAATAVAYLSAEQAVGVHTQLDRLSLELTEARAGHTISVLDRLTAEGRLSELDRVALATDQRSMDMVDRLLRTHELAGHDRDQVLVDALTERGFGDAFSPGRALYTRIQARSGDLTPRMTDFAGLVPTGLTQEQMGRGLELADAADARRRELGVRTSAKVPEWARTALGPVPADVFAAADWEQKAGWAAAYREMTGWTDQAVPLGPDPGASHAEQRATWLIAHAKLDLRDSRSQEAEMSDGQLRVRIAAGERERNWAPVHVDAMATATARAATESERDGVIWSEHGRQHPETASTTDAAEATAAAERDWAKYVELEAAREARSRFFAHAAVTLDHADRAKEELVAVRGQALVAETKETTAAEWLAAERESRIQDDPHRVISEPDIIDDERQLPAPAEDEPLLEAAAPDIREGAERHPSEDTDGPRDEIPSGETLAEIVARAQDANAEMDARDELERMWHDDDRDAAEDIDDDEDVSWD